MIKVRKEDVKLNFKMRKKMKTSKYILTAILAILGLNLTTKVEAQDLTLSQPYSSSLYLAPSFAGMSNGGKAFLTYRNQWPGLSGGYNSVLMGCDYFFRRQSSSLGVLLSYDNQAGIFTTLEFKPQYNYRIEVSRGLYFRPGIELSAYYKAVKTDELVFADQIAVDGTILNKNEIERLDKTGGLKIDVAASVLLYNNDFWIGADVHHLTQTDVSFVGNEAKTPMKITAMGGYRFVYDKNWQRGTEDALTATLLLQRQSEFNQMHIGIFWHKMPLELGISYRDLPFLSKGDLMNRDAFICMAGVSINESLKISYSYDITLSKLSGYTNGAHEIVLSVKFDQRNENDLSFFCY